MVDDFIGEMWVAVGCDVLIARAVLWTTGSR